jgi:hypothetical protein
MEKPYCCTFTFEWNTEWSAKTPALADVPATASMTNFFAGKAATMALKN